MQPGRLLLAVAALVALLAPAPEAQSRVVRRACRDGVPPVLTRCVAGCSRLVRCDVDLACDRTCTFAIRVCGEVACVDDLVPVPVGSRGTHTVATMPGARPTRFVLRCLAHPRNLPCPTTSTTSTTTSTSTSVTTLVCPTTTTLGVPDCGGTPTCLGLCRSGQTCANVDGQCGFTGPVLCGGVFSVCGGECPQGSACTPRSVPAGCPSIGCDCQ